MWSAWHYSNSICSRNWGWTQHQPWKPNHFFVIRSNTIATRSKKVSQLEAGAKLIHVIPIVSGEKDLEFTYDKRTDSALQGARDGPCLHWSVEVSLLRPVLFWSVQSSLREWSRPKISYKCRAYKPSVQSCVDRNLVSFLWNNGSAEGRTEDDIKTQMEKDVS